MGRRPARRRRRRNRWPRRGPDGAARRGTDVTPFDVPAARPAVSRSDAPVPPPVTPCPTCPRPAPGSTSRAPVAAGPPRCAGRRSARSCAALGGVAIADAIEPGRAAGLLLGRAAAIVLAGLIAGLILRRTPWVLTVLLVPAAHRADRASATPGPACTTAPAARVYTPANAAADRRQLSAGLRPADARPALGHAARLGPHDRHHHGRRPGAPHAAEDAQRVRPRQGARSATSGSSRRARTGTGLTPRAAQHHQRRRAPRPPRPARR